MVLVLDLLGYTTWNVASSVLVRAHRNRPGLQALVSRQDGGGLDWLERVVGRNGFCGQILSTAMKLHQVLTGAANTFDDKAAIAVGNVEDYPFTVSLDLVLV